MKKAVILLFIIVFTIIITGCGNDSDAVKFKKEYEKINDQKIEGTSYKYLNLTIEENNNVIYKTDEEIIPIIKQETAVVYFGFSKCPWCRSMINNLLKATSDLGIEKVYYVDISNIRDTLEFYEDGTIVRTSGGTVAYNELVSLLGKYLDNYIVYDENNNPVETEVKRIYAPNVLVVKEGKILGITTGVSENLQNPYTGINENTNKESYDMLYELLKEIKPNSFCLDNGNC